MKTVWFRLRDLFLRPDPTYDYYTEYYQAKGSPARWLYLFLYLLPGLIAYGVINVPEIYQAGMRLTGLSGPDYQYAWLILISIGWHMVLPFVILRYHDRLSWRESLAFLSLNRIDWRGCTYLLALAFVLFTLLTLPYMAYIQRPLYAWLDAVPLFRIPDYSIFKSAEALYGFPPALLLLLFVGNFVGEELYFRGYLMKKTAFLGRHLIWVNGALFAVYHFFQIAQTWPLVIPSMAFPLLMHWRKNLYVCIFFHLLVNLAWAPLLDLLLPLLP